MERPRYVSEAPLAEVQAELWGYANAGPAASRAAAGRAAMVLHALPSRDHVAEVVRRALIEDAGMPAAWFPEFGTFVADAVTEAVVALLLPPDS